MELNLSSSLKAVVERALKAPMYLATGSSWRRFMFEDGKVAVEPTNHPKDNHPDLTGDTALLQLMATSPQLLDALTKLLKLFDETSIEPSKQHEYLKLTIVSHLAVAKADNVEGKNNDLIRQLKMKLFNLELSGMSYLFYLDPFLKSFEAEEGWRPCQTEIKDAITRLEENTDLSVIQLINLEGIEGVVANSVYQSSDYGYLMF
ncbi:hypothetical protein QX249_10535 [Vibrio parahaemolyticus]|uniref:Uncharacterized protein n=1 Tax=Vibrio parahaemolyticus TaxID=670 RepID=A0AAW8PXY7_VIBPH|nr:hypothetical protein [Vibrio parahaemolyticus]MDS1821097.1 hypothetical protein [Vibrio parahaemolyticus]